MRPTRWRSPSAMRTTCRARRRGWPGRLRQWLEGGNMIGKLKGTLDEIGEDHCTVDVHGVGYVAHCSTRTLAQLPSPGEAVTLFIETYVREDMIRLYGFQSALEREWFRLLMNNV